MKIFLSLYFSTGLVHSIETHSNFNPALNPAGEEYAQEARDSFNSDVSDGWSDRRKKYLQMVAGMNHLWNTGQKDVLLATAKPLSGYPEGTFQIGNKMPSVDEIAERYGHQDTKSKKPKN